MPIKFPSLQKIIIGAVASFFTFQIISLMISEIFPSIPVYHGGIALLIMLTCIAVISLFVLAINLNDLKRKESLIFVVIIFGMLILAYYKLPSTLPQIFSISPEATQAIKNTIGSIVG